MASNRNLGENPIEISGRPEEHLRTLVRQGQYVRLLHARKCPCIKNGTPQLSCLLCKGRGYRTIIQKEIDILEENSPHYEDGYVYPNYIPISSVKKVQKWIHETGGGNVFYDIEEFGEDYIKLEDNGNLPKRYEAIKATYKYDNYISVTNENPIHNGLDFLLYTTTTEIDTTKETSNPLDVYGDIISVSRIYNKTQEITYIIKSFSKSLIKIDPVLGSVLSIQYIGLGTSCSMTLDPDGNLILTPVGTTGESHSIDLTEYEYIEDLSDYINTLTSYTMVVIGTPTIYTSKLNEVSTVVNIKTIYNIQATETPPLSTDILEVDYIYAKPILAMVTRIKTNNIMEKFAEDMKVGDVTLTLNGAMFVSKGDCFTVMTTILKGQSVIIRGAADFDEIPTFDVTEIVENIEDEDGVLYDNTKWELSEYNNLVWTTSTKPALGKKYSVNYLYRPTYQIYRAENQDVNIGNKRFPHRAFGHIVNKFNLREIEVNQ